jgi:hypothetical protein
MKQLSIFLVFILFLNTFALISTNKNEEYEIPQIIKKAKTQDLNIRNERSFKRLSSEEDNEMKKYENIEEAFNPEKILNWINDVQRKDISAMKKEEVNHILDGIKTASVKIQNYLSHSSRVIGANINMIELKVDEIDKIDLKVSSLKPEYKNELERINSGSGSLVNALNNEKNAIKKVLLKLRSRKSDLKKTANRTTSVAKKLQKFDYAGQVKDKIDSLLVPFIKFDNFENSRKKLMTIVDTDMSTMNFDKELSAEGASVLAKRIIEDNWKNIITEKVELKEEKKEEIKKEITENPTEDDEDDDDDFEDQTEEFNSKDATKIEEKAVAEPVKRKTVASKRKNEKKVHKIMTLRKQTNVIDEITDESTKNKFNKDIRENSMKDDDTTQKLDDDKLGDDGLDNDNNASKLDEALPVKTDDDLDASAGAVESEGDDSDDGN